MPNGSDKPNYYEILGIQITATSEEIKRTFRKLANDYHPDKLAGVPEPIRKLAEDKFKEINEAYEVLKDPEGRRIYDWELQTASAELKKQELIRQIQNLVDSADLEAAVRVAKSLYEQFPDDSDCRNIYAELAYALAIQLAEAEKLDRAESYFKEAIDITADEEFKSRVQADLGLLRSRKEREEEEKRDAERKKYEAERRRTEEERIWRETAERLETERRREEEARRRRESEKRAAEEREKIEAERRRKEEEIRRRVDKRRQKIEIIGVGIFFTIVVIGLLYYVRVVTDPFLVATKIAEKAAEFGKNAKSPDALSELATKWQQASEKMSLVSESDRRYKAAQDKVLIYRKNGELALKEAERLRQEAEDKRKRELPSEVDIDYSKLRDLLAAGQWEEADAETYSVLTQAAEKVSGQKYVLDGLVIRKLIPCDDFRTINKLWVDYSNGKYGFSIQKHIWESFGGDDQGDDDLHKNYDVQRKNADAGRSLLMKTGYKYDENEGYYAGFWRKEPLTDRKGHYPSLIGKSSVGFWIQNNLRAVVWKTSYCRIH